MRMARGMSSAADALLLWICFAMHDLPLFCDQGKRWTTNCASLFAFVHSTRPDLTSAFFEGIQQPGYAAHQAIQNFLAAIASWLNPEEHTLTGLLLAGLIFKRTEPAAADAGDMVKIAVRCSSSLEQVIAELDRSGYYNREHCGPGDISMETGFQDFDPNTRVGRLRWSQLGRLLRMRFKQPVCKLAELRKVKDAWLQHMQSEKTVHRFLADDEVLYEPVVLAGGGFPDQLRIEVTKQRLNADTFMAFEDFSSAKICSGEYDMRVETEWTQFSSTLIRIGASLLRKDLLQLQLPTLLTQFLLPQLLQFQLRCLRARTLLLEAAGVIPMLAHALSMKWTVSLAIQGLSVLSSPQCALQMDAVRWNKREVTAAGTTALSCTLRMMLSQRCSQSFLLEDFLSNVPSLFQGMGLSSRRSQEYHLMWRMRRSCEALIRMVYGIKVFKFKFKFLFRSTARDERDRSKTILTLLCQVCLAYCTVL